MNRRIVVETDRLTALFDGNGKLIPETYKVEAILRDILQSETVSTSTKNGTVIDRWELYSFETELNSAMNQLRAKSELLCMDTLQRIFDRLRYIRDRVPNGKVSFEGNEVE